MDLQWFEEARGASLIDSAKVAIVANVYADRTGRGWFLRIRVTPGGGKVWRWELHPALFASMDEAKAVGMVVVRMGVAA